VKLDPILTDSFRLERGGQFVSGFQDYNISLDSATQDNTNMQLSGIEKLKLTKELGGIRSNITSASGIGKLKMVKRIGEIRVLLGGKAQAIITEQKMDGEYIAELMAHTTEIAKKFGDIMYSDKIADAEHYFRDTADKEIITFPTFLMNILKSDERRFVFDEKSKTSLSIQDYMTKIFCGYLNKLVGSSKRNGVFDYEKIVSYFDGININSPSAIETNRLFKNDIEQNQDESQPALVPEGKDNEVKTAKGTKVVTGFTVVEASRLIISHDEQGNANPLYPHEMQPRDRTRDTSQAQISRIAKNLDPDMLGRTRVAYQGAPIVGKDGVVESGNGRAMAITLAYKLGKADEYRDWLLDIADMYGLNPEKIKHMKRPVLVRVRKSDVDRVQFAMEANQSDMMAMTATEKAKADANRLTDAIVSKMSIDGDLTAASNRDFILAFLSSLGDDETAGLLTTSGQPTKQLYDRAQAAVFAKAYNDDRLLELMADTEKPEIGNIIKSLNQAAQPFIRARAISDKVTHETTRKIGDAIEISLDQQAVDAIIKATEMLKKAKDSGMPIEELIKQSDLFGDTDPVVAQMALFIKENNKSSTRMGAAFQAMAEFVVKELENRRNNSLFVDEPEISMVDVLKSANAQLQKQYGDDVKVIGGSGGFIDMFTQTRGQSADREAFLIDRLKKSLFAGDMKTAMDGLNELDKSELITVLLKNGFSLAGTKTVNEIMTFVQSDLLKAVKLKTDGFGLRDIKEQQTAVDRVNSAYTFNASDDFKAWLAESLDKPDYSPFVTAKAMDEAAKRHGAGIEWGFFGGAPDDDLALDSANMIDVNQFKEGDHVINIDNNHDMTVTYQKGYKVYMLGSNAWVHANKLKHASGKEVETTPMNILYLDDASGDAVEQDGYVGKISKAGVIVGRVDIGGDGKAMVFVGAAGDKRVEYESGREAMYSDDDAPDMVDWLFEGLQEKQPETNNEKTNNETTTESEQVPVPDDSVDTKAQTTSTGNPEIDEQKNKLQKLVDKQARMKAVNKILKNKKLDEAGQKEALIAAGFNAEVAMVGRPDFVGRTGYADYELTNNNAVIRNTQKRILELEARDMAASKVESGSRETRYDFDDGTIDLDYADDRLRVNFDSKPDSAMITKLKQNGFKWSPTNTAWQRQLTDNAINTANYLFDTNIQTAASVMQQEVNAPRVGIIPPPVAVDPVVTDADDTLPIPQEFNPENHIKIASDSIETLRKQDIERLFEQAPYDIDAWDDLRVYIIENRPELAVDVIDAMDEVGQPERNKRTQQQINEHEKRIAEIKEKGQAIKDYLSRGGKVVLRTYLRITPLSNPDHLKIGADGVYISERNKWAFLGEEDVDQLFSQVQKEQNQSGSTTSLDTDKTAAFTAELDALKQETDIEAFDQRLDEIAARIEAAGMMEALDAKLNETADVLTGLLAEAEKAAG
jgi:hypothetical protein